uniref:Uncharacterized protein n=1 Tax=Globisporangium ultimum (strain ATCC 200006 / CBS 805.95 / DAOM BR144) TaxID=431595 RepID=K3WWX6_GLOUD
MALKTNPDPTKLIPTAKNANALCAAFRAHNLTAVPSDLLMLKNLVHIDLSKNQLSRFPGHFVALEMLKLEVLHLSDNLLYILEDVLALASSPRLRDLNVLRNPLRLQNNRVYLLEALFSQRGSDESLLSMIQQDDELKFADAAELQPPHTMKYRRSLPRNHGFPMLQKLNDEWITDAEIRDVELECGHRIKYYRPASSSTTSRLKKYTKAKATNHQQGFHDSGSNKRSAVNGLLPTGDTHLGHEDQDPLAKRRFDGSRMTIKQMLKNESHSAGIPKARVIQRFQINVENGDDVTVDDQDEESHQHGHSHMAFPSAYAATIAVPTRQQSNGSMRDVVPEHVDKAANDVSDDEQLGEQRIIHRLFHAPVTEPSKQRQSIMSKRRPVENVHAQDGGRPPESDNVDDSVDDQVDTEVDDPWNYPISTFDALDSEARQYVRFKSKQSGGTTIERDDHFFASSIFLDCVAQAERSRRLTVRAVDVLSQRGSDEQHEYANELRKRWPSVVGSRSTPSIPSCSAATSLVESMTTKFSKQQDHAIFEKILAFQEQQIAVDSCNIQAAVGDYYQNEHMAQKQKNSLLFRAAQQQQQYTSEAPRASSSVTASSAPPLVAEPSLEDSLSKLKLRNAVDLANTLLGPKQQKHMLQMLIDADEKVIEEERIAQEQTAHRYKLHLIQTRGYTSQDDRTHINECMQRATMNTTASPWQKRNWRAVKVHQDNGGTPAMSRSSSAAAITTQKRKPTHLVADNDPRTAESADEARSRTVTRFCAIETVEKAALDPLAHVNSHDLLVRCAEIRTHADAHMSALHAHRDHFFDDEARWEHMRQDPINVVRRHLKRRLYHDAQEVQIGSTQVFYSPLFN